MSASPSDSSCPSLRAARSQRCVETLVEFVQGNAQGSNTRFLLDTKLLEILDRLIQKSEIPGVELSDCIELQGAVSLLLLALLYAVLRLEP